MRLSGLKDTGYITGDELVGYFFRFLTYPKVLGADAIKQAIAKAVQQGLMGYVPYLMIPASGIPQVQNPSLVSFERTIFLNELDLAGYLLAPQLAKQLLAPPAKQMPDESTEAQQPAFGSISTTTPVANEGQPTFEYKSQTSSIERSVLVDVVNGVQPARHYKLEAITDKSKFFELINILQSLSDEAEDMTIKIEVKARTTKKFDRTWINGVIEEPLDELNIKASTRLE